MNDMEPYALLLFYVAVTLILAKLGSRVIIRVNSKLLSQGRISSNLVDFVGSLLRGLIWLVAAAIVVAEVSVTFGLQGAMAESISSFLSFNAGRLGVMLVIVIGGYVTLRIFGIVYAEYRRHSSCIL